MSPFPQVYTNNELLLLQLVTQPSGMTIEQLAQQMVKYERVQVRAAEAFALDDPTKLESMQKFYYVPKTRLSNLVSPADPEICIRMFGPIIGAPKVDELKVTLARYENLQKKCVTFEDHFEAVHHAFVPNQPLHEHMILGPLCDIRGAYDVYAKRHNELKYQMILEEAPHRIGEPGYWLDSKVVLAKRHNGRKDYPIFSQFAQVTAAEAGRWLDLSNLPTLLKSKFQTICMSSDSVQVPDIWRVVNFDMDSGTYVVVFPNRDPLLLEKEELIQLLTESKPVVYANFISFSPKL